MSQAFLLDVETFEAMELHLPRWRRMLRVFAAVMRIAAGVLIALWLLGVLLTDRFAWSQWLWWIPTLAALIAALWAMIWTLPGRRGKRRLVRRIGWCAAALTIAGWFGMVEHHLFKSPRYERSDAGLRIVHWNGSRRDEGTRAIAAAAIRDTVADIGVFSFGTHVAKSEVLDSARDAGFTLATTGHLAVMTHLPIVELRTLVQVDGIEIALARIDASTQGLGELRLHVIDLPSDPTKGRMATARRVRELLEQVQAPEPDLVIGDFNTTRGSASLAVMYPGLAEAFATCGRGYGASFPEPRPWLHIDLMLHRPDLDCVNYHMRSTGLTKHRMQVLDVGDSSQQ